MTSDFQRSKNISDKPDRIQVLIKRLSGNKDWVCLTDFVKWVSQGLYMMVSER